MLDDISMSDTIPTNDIRTDEVEFSHEAKIGKISDKTIFYLMSRGLSEEDAKAMIVRGFAYPISKELPIEYAVEMNYVMYSSYRAATLKTDTLTFGIMTFVVIFIVAALSFFPVHALSTIAEHLSL